MKYLNILFVTLMALILSACGGKTENMQDIIASGDMEAIRAKKDELVSQEKELARQIAELDSAIASGTENSNLPLITTFNVSAQEFRHYVELQGDVTTDQNVLIYPEVSGTIIKMHVKEGQKVSKGQLLATIDDNGMSSQLAQMNTQLELAKTTFERQKQLWDKKIGSEIQFLQAKANFESQKNSVSQMEQQLEKFKLRAPFSGIIDDVIKDEGNVVAPAGPGSEVFRIVNLSKMYIEVSAPETFLPSIVAGKEAKVYFPVLDKTLMTTVLETGNFINPNNRSFRVKVPVPNSDGMVKPNLSARVKINDYTSKKAIMVPQSVISENAEGEQYVYIVKAKNQDGVAQTSKKIIETGLSQDGFVEVTKGLSGGDEVIMEGARSVKDGQDVKILKN